MSILVDRQTQTKPLTRKIPSRIAIDPNMIYSRREAAQVVRSSESTLTRAWCANRLAGFRRGNRVAHSGAQLLEWLAEGGHTS